MVHLSIICQSFVNIKMQLTIENSIQIVGVQEGMKVYLHVDMKYQFFWPSFPVALVGRYIS